MMEDDSAAGEDVWMQNNMQNWWASMPSLTMPYAMPPMMYPPMMRKFRQPRYVRNAQGNEARPISSYNPHPKTLGMKRTRSLSVSTTRPRLSFD